MKAQSPNTALIRPAERFKYIETTLEHRTEALARSLPVSLPVARFQQIACNALRRNPYLLKCELGSIVDAISFSAEMGLEIGGPTGEAYLVPFWSKGMTKATFIPGYRGLIKLALESQNIVGIEAHVVEEGDDFEYEYGTNAALVHRPKHHAGAEVTYAYAIADKLHGRPQFYVMSRAKLDKLFEDAKKKSKGNWDRSPWMTNREEMYRKSPVRNLAKYLDLRGADKLHKAIAEEDRNLGDRVPVAIDDTSRRDALRDKLAGDKPPPDMSDDIDDADFEELQQDDR